MCIGSYEAPQACSCSAVGLEVSYTVSGSIYVRYKILKARKLYNYYASTSHMNLHNLTTYHPESKEKIGNLQWCI